MPYREFHYRWEYDLKASPEKLWPFVSDTNRFNRDTNVPALEVQEGKQRLRNARRRAKLSIFGMPVQWEEQPFEWVRPSRFGVARSYSKGPIAELELWRFCLQSLMVALSLFMNFGPGRNPYWA